MRNYTTIQGDTFDYIAYQLMNDKENGVSRLISANSEYGEYAVFPAGIELNIPDNVTISTNNIPPWRR